MTTTNATVLLGDLGYVVHIGRKGGTGAFAATLGAVIRKDGASVTAPVLIGDYTGDSPGTALDALLLAAQRVYQTASS
jgi:hypothetical protein